jgi:hypothetical protein
MFFIESKINGRWVRLSRKTYTQERAANMVAYLIEDVTIADASEEYRYVQA